MWKLRESARERGVKSSNRESSVKARRKLEIIVYFGFNLIVL